MLGWLCPLISTEERHLYPQSMTIHKLGSLSIGGMTGLMILLFHL
jgi:hypothetical protein